MKKFLLMAMAFLCLSSWAHGQTWPSKKPQLIVFLVIDQFRADYLSRFKEKFTKNGFRALMDDGAYFPYGEYDVMQSMTCVGHATVLTGAYPYQMGIPLNEWYDQKTQSVQYCVEDANSRIVGSDNPSGRSPKNLTTTTVGDELKNVDIPTRFYSIALKDRAAILMGGHRADMALWFDNKANRWVSSSYYLKDKKLPAWVQDYNKRFADEKCDQAQPCGIKVTMRAAEEALDKLNLGAGKTVDFLAVSFSSHDFAGHAFGPNAPIMEDMTLAEDQAIASLRQKIEQKVPGGLKNVLFVLTGDHGIPPGETYLKPTGIDSGAIDEKIVQQDIEAALSKKFGSSKKGNWIAFVSDFNFYFDEKAILQARAKLPEVEREVKTVMLKQPGFAYVITRSEVESRMLPPGIFERQILKTYFPARSGHVVGLPRPFYANASHNYVTHMTGYTYDRTVPIIFSGLGIKKGVYADKAEVVDIAPTLSFMLGILPPASSEGKVLKQILSGVQ